MLDVYRATTEQNLRQFQVTGNIVVVHDPQPAGLVPARGGDGRRWVWRCHIDISTPDPVVWDFLRPLVNRYDHRILDAGLRLTPRRSAVHGGAVDHLGENVGRLD